MLTHGFLCFLPISATALALSNAFESVRVGQVTPIASPKDIFSRKQYKGDDDDDDDDALTVISTPAQGE